MVFATDPRAKKVSCLEHVGLRVAEASPGVARGESGHQSDPHNEALCSLPEQGEGGDGVLLQPAPRS